MNKPPAYHGTVYVVVKRDQHDVRDINWYDMSHITLSIGLRLVGFLDIFVSNLM